MLVVVELLGALATLAFLILFVKFVNVALWRYLVVSLCVNLVLDPVPDRVNALFIIQAFKNTSSSKSYSVVSSRGRIMLGICIVCGKSMLRQSTHL